MLVFLPLKTNCKNFKKSPSYTNIPHQHWNIYPISVANRQLFFHYKILVITNWRRKNHNKKVTKIKSTSFIQTFVLIFKKRVYYGRLKKVFLKLLLEFCSGWIADVKSLWANVDELLTTSFLQEIKKHSRRCQKVVDLDLIEVPHY